MIGSALVIASLALLPGQPHLYFGLEAIAAGLFVAATGIAESVSALRRRKTGDPLAWTVVPLAMIAISSLPDLIGGTMLAAGIEAGLYWIAVGIVLSFIATLQNGWVLLVEILR